MGLDILPKTIAFTPLDLSPIGLTEPPFVKVFGWDLVPLTNRLFFVCSQMSATVIPHLPKSDKKRMADAHQPCPQFIEVAFIMGLVARTA